MIQTIKLANLRRSEKNVRTTPPKNIDSMAASIRHRGIIQNLLVTPSKPRGTFEIIAGDRRFLGASMLAELGEIDAATYDVPVKVVKGDDRDLRELSTVENFERENLTPAEECRAFQHFIGVDGDIDAVAKRFGITRRFIEGRLRLAALAEPIFAALSDGEITLDVAKAYAATENHERQLAVFNTYGGHSYATADTIRRAITTETMQARDPVALLVGEDAYVAAGGRIDRDLYGDHGDRWCDPEIAQRLAAETMEVEAKRVGEETGLAWIRPVATSYAYEAARDLHPVAVPQAPLDDEQTTRLAAIEERMEAISEECEREELDDDAYATLEAEHQTLDAERDALFERPRLLPDELKPLVGAFLLLTPTGEMKLDTRYYSETRLRGGNANGDDNVRGGGLVTSPPTPDRLAPGGKPLTAKLADELAIQSRDVLAAALLAQPALALDFALFAMVDGQRSHDEHGTTIAARSPSDPHVGALPDTRARRYIAEVYDTLDTDWAESRSAVDRFEAFRALDDEAKTAWLVMIVARSLEAKPQYSTRGRAPLLNRLASILELDVAQWWRPTALNFFDRVPKGALLALLGEVGGAALPSRYASAKKGEIAESCQKLFAGEAIVEAEVKEHALAWVPNAMRFDEAATAAPPDVDDVEEVDGDEADDGDASEPADGEVDTPEAIVAE